MIKFNSRFKKIVKNDVYKSNNQTYFPNTSTCINSTIIFYSF